MKVALITESALPHMNGVTQSLLQVAHHLRDRGDDVLVIAPRLGRADGDLLGGAASSLLPSVPLPSYPQVRLAVPRVTHLAGLLQNFGAEVVHLASPFVLGWQALRASERLGIASVAIYQTDVPGYARRYGIAAAEHALAEHVGRIHGRATLTLAPSQAALGLLADAGIGRLRLWTRGVDAERFNPGRRSEAWRASIAPGELVIGYVGRLAPEKQVEDLRAIADIPGTRLVIVGDGPSRAGLQRQLPNAVFLGFLGGDALAEAVAGFDLFVHPGERESFGQTIQEAQASGVPVVATGCGGPLDLVRNSIDGWLYRPGDLDDLRARVLDLIGDAAKRQAFAEAARTAVADRSWARRTDELVGHYRDAIGLRAAGDPWFVRGFPGPAGALGHRPRRYVALGDSLTEGLSDPAKQADGRHRGWADRLAMLLAHADGRASSLDYANLAVRSRRIDDVVGDQLPAALELRADLVSVLVGGNDLLRRGADPVALAERLAAGVERARASGASVLVVTPFTPPHRALRRTQRRFAAFNRVLMARAEAAGAIVLEFWTCPEFLDARMWAADRVHLSAQGHRALAYRAAALLGVRDAESLAALDLDLHGADREPRLSTARWLWVHVRPWLGRRLRGRTADDGIQAKHTGLVPVSARGVHAGHTARPVDRGLTRGS